MKELSLRYIIFLFSIYGYSQTITPETTFYKLTSLNGEMNLNYFYWDQKLNRGGTTDHIESSFVSGSIFLNSRSYFWHPNFLALDLDVGYSPETGQRLSLVTPDRNEVNTLKKIHARGYLFQDNPLSFTAFVNFIENYNNRENLTNLKSKFNNWGSTLTYSNEYLPFSVSYNHGEGEQLETQTDREYKTEHNTFESRVNKSFGSNDWNEFLFSHNGYVYENIFRLNGLNLNSNIIGNKINSWSLNNRFFFDPQKNYNFNSRISNEDQQGNFNFKRFQILENVLLKLPEELIFSGNYNFFNIKEDIQDTKQHNLRGILSHQLYNSLRTSITYEYNSILNTQYEETIIRSGLDIKYVKKIPLDGVLSLSYRVNINQQSNENEVSILYIQNEEYTISDGQIVLLNTQNIDPGSVIVRDITGTIIYQINIDYILIVRNEFLEIQRIPGGQIPNNATVYVDYMAAQPRSYKFNAITDYFRASISLFKNKMEFYFNTSKQDYTNIENTEFLTLNYFNQNVYGARFRFNFINGGIEYDNYRSTIIPYRLIRYYLILQGNIKGKLFYTLNGDMRDYQMIVEEGMRQKYYNVSGNISYQFNPKLKLNLQGSYIKQEGEGIDLDLQTARLELTTRFRRLFFTASLELYKNEFFNETTDFKKISFLISRKF